MTCSLHSPPHCIYGSVLYIWIGAVYTDWCCIYGWAPYIQIGEVYTDWCRIYRSAPYIQIHTVYTDWCRIYGSAPYIQIHAVYMDPLPPSPLDPTEVVGTLKPSIQYTLLPFTSLCSLSFPSPLAPTEVVGTLKPSIQYTLPLTPCPHTGGGDPKT